MSALIAVQGLSRRYVVRGGVLGTSRRTVTAVDGVDLAVNRGETVGLVGESGCGKSTLARCVAGLERPSAGRVLYDGREMDDPRVRDNLPRLIQMVFQDPFSSLNPRRSVGFSVAEGLWAMGMGDRAARRERVMELLDQVGLLPEHADRYPHQFSGGQRQRVAIARALATNPSLVVCDEPVSALDVSVQAQVINLLCDLKARLGLAYLFISHDLAVVGHISDRTAVMYLGRIMELAPTDTIMDNPAHPYTRALLAAAPIPDPARRQAARTPLAGDAPSLFSPPPGCVFHPRCPEAMPECAVSSPKLLETSPGHFVRCLKETP
ncbi:MAG: ABC transporter ATP-binding protein [Desulfovibrionaceae bacterium]|nr:ABC transporter ATP-binding protein [Desulfovibrionaceae bacterium]